MIERHFGPIPANPNLPPPPDMAIAAAHRPRPARGRSRSGAAAARLPRLPHARLRHPAFEALTVAADLLATGRASRLYRTLVREQRLAQDVSVFPFPIVGGASMFAVWATARPERQPRAAGRRAAGGDRAAGGGGAERRRARSRPQPARRRGRVEPRADQRASRSAFDVHLPLRRAGAHQHRASRLLGRRRGRACRPPWPRRCATTTAWCSPTSRPRRRAASRQPDDRDRQPAPTGARRAAPVPLPRLRAPRSWRTG